MRSVLDVHWKDWCWSWNSNTLATWCEELTHLKRPWCWERLRAEGEGDDRGWDGWMASPTRWTWVWVNSRCWWWRGRPGVLQFMGSQRVGHDWATELNWPDTCIRKYNVSTFRLYYSKIWQRMVYSICQLVYPLLQNSYIPPSKTFFSSKLYSLNSSMQFLSSEESNHFTFS